ncbi:hypothetical protein SARC_00368 [Sphaeroforma arctica JP610]|uniref:peptidylprolyl isomerase n=1 Tax=Sphaeroforma arctica JP610 TaxID=667725 RepID=A0A0L0GFA6_9EUKA|nr:hypothetical protein SARC_00368 [Sphaeroforma arctica JP610]KNC87544.1 hypothetical protein SARC_00368 [Sphaeroforma arctica JP610]|eukprot:XP_014161446.1 hypothetical protein SARC_00368 [Sphaeroforma arctica JP610]
MFSKYSVVTYFYQHAHLLPSQSAWLKRNYAVVTYSAAAANVNHNPNKVNAVMDEQQANNDVEGDDEDQADVADEENDDDADAQEDNDGKQNEPDEPEDVDNGPDLEALIAAHLESDGMASNGVKAVSDFIHKTYSDVDVDYFEGDRWKTRLQKPQDVAFSSPVNIFWNVKTNMGALKFQLRPDYARYHCANTVYLSLLGFYDNTIWHRIIPQFMGQFGDPTGTGGGSPGYRYSGEFNKSPEAKHDGRGVLSTANAGPGTDGSQVFVLFAEARHLNGKHTVFGRMVSGDDTLDKIEKVGSRSGAPSKEVLLEKAWISVELPY